MKLIIEWYIYSLFFALLCFISTGFISASLQIKNANEFYNYAEDYIVINDFSEEAFKQLETQAITKGYEFKYQDRSTVIGNDEEGDAVKLYDNCYFIELSYTVNIPFLGVEKADTNDGYIKGVS